MTHPTRQPFSILPYLLPVLWMVAIYAMSSVPGERVPQVGVWDLLVKKGGHLAAYALLALLWRRALAKRRAGCSAALPGQSTMPDRTGLQDQVSGWLALAITALYAVTDEIHQTYVPGRNGTPLDVLVDAVGASLGMVAAAWSSRIKQR